MRSLRDYQLAASAAVDGQLSQVTSTLVVLPTGTGKTVLMSDVARRWSEKGAVLLLAHRVELLDQAAARFEPDLGYTPQVVQASRKVDWQAVEAGRRVLVGSVQTLWREKRLRQLGCHPFALLLIDEAHHAVARTYRAVWDYLREQSPQCRVLGVTATPRRTDKKALGIVFDSVAYQMEIHEAIELGWLVPPVEQRIVIEGVDFAPVPLTVNEFGEADFSASALEALMIEERPLQAVAVPLLEMVAGRRCLVFTAGVAHAHLLAGILNRSAAGSATAIDGKNFPPDDPRRSAAVEDFRAGKIRFLCNFGIFTEGTDLPECDVVCVARPTRSLSVLVQMVGRALRPLPGVVDGVGPPEARRAAIARSDKPSALVTYFIPKAANVRALTVYDALGGNYKDDVKALAAQIAGEHPGGPVLEDLARARALAELFAEEDSRKRLRAQVSYRTERIGAHAAELPGEDLANLRRGGASDAQIQALVGLGVQYATAAGYTKKQAGVVIDKLRGERCTIKQRSILARFGENPDVNFHEARKIIDEIAAGGWKPRGAVM